MLKNKVGGLIIPDFKVYCKVTAIKAIWSWHKDRKLYQWNRIDPYTCGQLIFNKGTKTTEWRKDNFFQQWANPHLKSYGILNKRFLIRNHQGQKAMRWYIKVLKGKRLSIKNSIATKLSFKTEGEIKTFQINKNWDNLSLKNLPYKKC